LSLGALSGCDLQSLLEVESPGQITEEPLQQPGAADLLANSVVTHFECGYSGFMYDEGGKSDSFDRLAGAGVSGGETYGLTDASTGTGLCAGNGFDYTWLGSIQLSRVMGFTTYALLEGWTDQQVNQRERKLATVAVYTAAALGVLGEFFCETALDGGPLMTQDETLALAEEWATTALGHIATTGDFAVPGDATNSIEKLAYGLRARIRWARGESHWADALSDALKVPQGYTALVTRGSASTRVNKVYEVATQITPAWVMGPFVHWTGPANPVTGREWPNPIPFTGYRNLGIMPDGRAISDDQNPIRTIGNPTAVADTRVQTIIKKTQGPLDGPAPTKYASASTHLPLVSWNDIWLIRAEIEGGQAAINRVNEIRTARNLPLVTYANPNNADQILDMIIEERRRDLWLEGRFWSTKIQHTDRLWFPRGFGTSEFNTFPYQGAVTLLMPANEYELNPNLDLEDRGTGCDADRRPTLR
jgi:hypothetical protein